MQGVLCLKATAAFGCNREAFCSHRNRDLFGQGERVEGDWLAKRKTEFQAASRPVTQLCESAREQE